MRAALGAVVWTDLHARPRQPIIALPVGSCEQHGPHLPLDTDTRIASALAEGLADAYEPGEVLVAPPLAITASGEHGQFPGTLSIGTEATAQVLIELIRSADWSAGVVLVNGHGGNVDAVRQATATAAAEGRRVLPWWPRVRGGDAHAGYTETSLMLAIAPRRVRLGAAAAGRVEPVVELAADLRTKGVRAVSPTGVLGDPAGASATHGRVLLTRMVVDLVAAVDEWRT
jgi:mycofactocin system creatininase family protein